MTQQKKKGRYSNGSARRALRARIKAEGRPCAICGRPIDYSLPARHPMSYELDEIIPFSLGGSPIEYSNVQPAHRMCNNAKSNRVLYDRQDAGGKQDDLTECKNKTKRERFACRIKTALAISEW